MSAMSFRPDRDVAFLNRLGAGQLPGYIGVVITGVDEGVLSAELAGPGRAARAERLPARRYRRHARRHGCRVRLLRASSGRGVRVHDARAEGELPPHDARGSAPLRGARLAHGPVDARVGCGRPARRRCRRRSPFSAAHSSCSTRRRRRSNRDCCCYREGRSSEYRLRSIALPCPFLSWQRRCFFYGNWNRQVVQRREGVWLHHP